MNKFGTIAADRDFRMEVWFKKITFRAQDGVGRPKKFVLARVSELCRQIQREFRSFVAKHSEKMVKISDNSKRDVDSGNRAMHSGPGFVILLLIFSQSTAMPAHRQQ